MERNEAKSLMKGQTVVVRFNDGQSNVSVDCVVESIEDEGYRLTVEFADGTEVNVSQLVTEETRQQSDPDDLVATVARVNIRERATVDLFSMIWGGLTTVDCDLELKERQGESMNNVKKLRIGTSVLFESAAVGIIFRIAGTVVEPTEEEKTQEMGRECEPASSDCCWVKLYAFEQLVVSEARGDVFVNPVAHTVVHDFPQGRIPVTFRINDFNGEKMADYYNGDITLEMLWTIPSGGVLDMDQPLIDAMTVWLKDRWPELDGDPYREIELIFGEALRRARFEKKSKNEGGK